MGNNNSREEGGDDNLDGDRIPRRMASNPAPLAYSVVNLTCQTGTSLPDDMFPILKGNLPILPGKEAAISGVKLSPQQRRMVKAGPKWGLSFILPLNHDPVRFTFQLGCADGSVLSDSRGERAIAEGHVDGVWCSVAHFTIPQSYHNAGNPKVDGPGRRSGEEGRAMRGELSSHVGRDPTLLSPHTYGGADSDLSEAERTGSLLIPVEVEVLHATAVELAQTFLLVDRRDQSQRLPSPMQGDSSGATGVPRGAASPPTLSSESRTNSGRQRHTRSFSVGDLVVLPHTRAGPGQAVASVSNASSGSTSSSTATSPRLVSTVGSNGAGAGSAGGKPPLPLAPQSSGGTPPGQQAPGLVSLLESRSENGGASDGEDDEPASVPLGEVLNVEVPVTLAEAPQVATDADATVPGDGIASPLSSANLPHIRNPPRMSGEMPPGLIPTVSLDLTGMWKEEHEHVHVSADAPTDSPQYKPVPVAGHVTHGGARPSKGGVTGSGGYRGSRLGGGDMRVCAGAGGSLDTSAIATSSTGGVSSAPAYAVESDRSDVEKAEGMPAAAGAVLAAATTDALQLRERRKLAIVMVGLPARGKSFTASKLTRYLRWLGHDTRHFNVGAYRRKKFGCRTSADFFDNSNADALANRWEAAEEAMRDMLAWMDAGGQVGVYDATNSTEARRKRLVEIAGARCKVIFLESICNDPAVILENACKKIDSSPDYAQLTDRAAALADFYQRLANYEKVYEPVTSGSYIKMIDVVCSSSRGGQMQINEISGFLSSRMIFFLLNVHTQPRPIFLTRHGESLYNTNGRIGGDSDLSPEGELYALRLAQFLERRLPADEPQSVWTSTLRRTVRTARHLPQPKVQWRALDEINAGVCEGMTYKEIKQRMPEEYAARDRDKLRYRYPCGESYLDVIQRLEPVIIELERQRHPVVVVAHQAILRALYAYFMNQRLRDVPYIDIPLHTVIELAPSSTGMLEIRHEILVPTSTGNAPTGSQHPHAL